MIQFRDLQAQYKALRPRIDDAVAAVLASGQYIGGEPVKELEAQLAAYVGTKHCVTCGNGTDALQLALMAWGVGEGDAIFVPDFTFFSSGEVVSAVGATPVFVDVDGRTFNLDASKLEEAILAIEQEGRLRPCAVVSVDLFGLPADYAAIRAVCDRHGLLLLEDGAQGFGGSIDGKMACSFGDISTTSFFPAKPLGCYGDGGALFTDNDEWADLVRSFAVHGKGEMKYDNIRIGMNSRLDAMQAVILQVKLDSFVDQELIFVNEIASCYTEELEGFAKQEGIALPVVPEGYTSSWAQYTIQLPLACNRDALQSRLREKGIPTMVYYPKPMHHQRAFQGACIAFGDMAITKKLCTRVLSLPFGPYITHSEIDDVSNALRDSFENL